MSDNLQDPYTENKYDNYPGARQRSRPGSDPSDQVYEKVLDASGRLVSDKPANKTFLASRAKQEAHNIKARSLSQPKPKSSKSTTPSRPVSLRTILIFFLLLPLLSQFLTKSYTFNLSPHVLPPIQKYIRTSPLNPWRVKLLSITPEELSNYDGTREDLPVLIAVGGEVWDVSANRRIYGKGGSYNMMAGRDASRAFVTGCFETHLTHDLRGLSSEELKSLDHWMKFFANHAKYRLIGHVRNPPIDPSSPIPPPCRDSAEPPSSAHHAIPGPVKATENV